MRSVPVFLVRGGEIDVPASMERMEFRGPEVCAIGVVRWRTPDYFLFAVLFKVE
jgi:hypothetical protein